MRSRPATYSKTDLRKREILAAALSCFAENGFDETSLKDVANRSGASNGSIYHHFKSKEGIARSLYLSGIADYQGAVADALLEPDEAERGVCSMVSAHLFWVEKNPDWARFLSTMRFAEFMQKADPEMAESNRAWAERIFSWHAGHVGKGALRPLSPVIFICLVLGPCQELVRLWLAGVTPCRPLEYAEELSRAAWFGVRA